jgi:hypothetical protein
MTASNSPDVNPASNVVPAVPVVEQAIPTVLPSPRLDVPVPQAEAPVDGPPQPYKYAVESNTLTSYAKKLSDDALLKDEVHGRIDFDSAKRLHKLVKAEQKALTESQVSLSKLRAAFALVMTAKQPKSSNGRATPPPAEEEVRTLSNGNRILFTAGRWYPYTEA